jgi:hypothetical protein
MKKTPPFLSAAFTVVYFASNGVLFHGAEINFWNERRAQVKRHSSSSLLSQLPSPPTVGLLPSPVDSPAVGSRPSASFVGGVSRADVDAARTSLSLGGSAEWLDSLLSPFGIVRDIHVSSHSDRPLIFHIQDIHGNVDAQRNIAHMIGALSVDRGVTLVGLEGADGPFDLDDLRRFPDRDVAEQATGWGIKKNLIGGAEKIGITSEKLLTLWGIEDNALYTANVEAVKRSMAQRSGALSFLIEFNSALDRLKMATYSPLLAAYDANARAYESGHRGLAEYVAILTSLDRGKSSLPSRSPNIVLLMEAFALESKIDFKEVERERTNMVSQLAQKLNPTALKGLADQSLVYRSGGLSYSQYYAYVHGLCKSAKVDVDRFPALMDYIAYVGVSERINRARLLTEMTDLEETVATDLARGDRDRGVLSLSRDSHLLGKLLNNTMTPETWAQYQTRRDEVKGCVARATVLAKASGIDFNVVMPKNFDELVSPAENFCRLALERNAALTERLWKKMEDSHSDVAILVAGGFHTEGLTKHIKRRGGSYVVLTPRVETIDNEKNYMDAFARDPLPLEKLFDGEKIGLLTPRGLAHSADLETGLSTRQTLALAMSLQGLSKNFVELRGNASVGDIRKRLEQKLFEFRSAGELFRGISLPLATLTPEGVTIKIKTGENVRWAEISSSGVIHVSPSQRKSSAQRLLDLRIGYFLRTHSRFIFEGVAAVVFSPLVESRETTNKTLGKFIGIHQWEGRDFIVGTLLVGAMGLITFAPALALFYFAGGDNVDLSLRVLSAAVGLGALFRNNDFYVPAHLIINVFAFSINLILEAVNLIAKTLTFEVTYRIPYLTARKETDKKLMEPGAFYQTPAAFKELDLLFSILENHGPLVPVNFALVKQGINIVPAEESELTREWDLSPRPMAGEHDLESPHHRWVSWLQSHTERQLNILENQLSLMVRFQEAIEFQKKVLGGHPLTATDFDRGSAAYRDLWEELETTPSPYSQTPHAVPNPHDLLFQAANAIRPALSSEIEGFFIQRDRVESAFRAISDKSGDPGISVDLHGEDGRMLLVDVPVSGEILLRVSKIHDRRLFQAYLPIVHHDHRGGKRLVALSDSGAEPILSSGWPVDFHFKGTRLIRAPDSQSTGSSVRIKMSGENKVVVSYPAAISVQHIESHRPAGSFPPPGSWGIWDNVGFKSLPLNGFLETVVINSAAWSVLTFLLPVDLFSLSYAALNPFMSDAIFLWVVLSSCVYAGIFAVSFLIHLGTGVQRGAGVPTIRARTHGLRRMVREAWGASITASRGQIVGAMAIVAGVSLPIPWIAGLGTLWAALRHAYKNGTLDLQNLRAAPIAEGVTVVSYRTTMRAKAAGHDSRASLTDFVETLFLGGAAGPRLLPVEATVFALHINRIDSAMAAKAVLGTDDALLLSDPARWVSQEALSFMERRTTKEEMSRQMAFLNLVVQASRRGGPDSPVVVEMPTLFQWTRDPAASMGIAAALTAYGMGNRPLTLVAKESIHPGVGWRSRDAMTQAALDALSRFSPRRENPIAQGFKEGKNSVTLATGNQINVHGQFLLARIVEHAFGEDVLKNQQPYVLGKESSFDSHGIEKPIFLDIFLFATEFIKNFRMQSLFLIAA